MRRRYRILTRETIFSISFVFLGAVAIFSFITFNQGDETNLRAANGTNVLFRRDFVIHPNPNLTAEEVMEINVRLLRDNNTPVKNHGTRTLWNFTPPHQRESIGSFFRFDRYVSEHLYGDGEQRVDIDQGPRVDNKNMVEQFLYVTSDNAEQHILIMVLRRQQKGEYADCWLVESLIPIPSGVLAQLAIKHPSEIASAHQPGLSAAEE